MSRVILCACVVAAAAGAGSAPALAQQTNQFVWTKDAGVRVSDGSVPYIHKLRGGRFRLYYCGPPGGVVSAISPDGLNFEREPGVRIAPEGPFGNPEMIVCDATLVELNDGRVRMYYKGANGPGGPGFGIHKVFSAVSSDGLRFKKEGLRIDSEATGDRGWSSVPEAIKLPDGRVRVFYCSASGELDGLASATSRDGLSFERDPGTRVRGLVDPAITRLQDGTFLLLAVALQAPPGVAPQDWWPPGIYSFTSGDGLNFVEHQVVLQEEDVFDPTILRVDSKTYRIYYGKGVGGSPERPQMVVQSLTGRLQG